MKTPLLVAALLLAPLAPAFGGEHEDPGLQALMRGMAETAGVSADFREVKELALLAEPLVSRGTLYFIPPDRLARHTRSPSPSSLIVDGDRLTVADPAGGDRVELSQNPVARLFVDNLIVLFSGDLAALRRRYVPHFESGEDHWSLALEPRRSPVKDLIARITLRGDGTSLREMEVLETDGDRTRTFLSAVQVDRHFSPEEIRRFFSPLPDALPR
jgi:outer membrane lipoprotein-sorting protein